MNKSNKGNIHEEGMSLGANGNKSKSPAGEWVEEDFGKYENPIPKGKKKNGSQKKRTGNTKK
jgi:hypothetical protein